MTLCSERKARTRNSGYFMIFRRIHHRLASPALDDRQEGDVVPIEEFADLREIGATLSAGRPSRQRNIHLPGCRLQEA